MRIGAISDHYFVFRSFSFYSVESSLPPDRIVCLNHPRSCERTGFMVFWRQDYDHCLSSPQSPCLHCFSLYSCRDSVSLYKYLCSLWNFVMLSVCVCTLLDTSCSSSSHSLGGCATKYLYLCSLIVFFSNSSINVPVSPCLSFLRITQRGEMFCLISL